MSREIKETIKDTPKGKLEYAMLALNNRNWDELLQNLQGFSDLINIGNIEISDDEMNEFAEMLEGIKTDFENEADNVPRDMSDKIIDAIKKAEEITKRDTVEAIS